MKKIINFLVYLVLITIIISTFLYCYFSIFKTNKETIIFNPKVKELNQKENYPYNEKLKTGDLIFNFYPNIEINENKENYLSISLPYRFKEDENNYIDKTSLEFIFSKNNNLEKLSIEKWFKELDIENQRHTPYMILKEEKFFNSMGVEIYKVVFYSSGLLGSYYYNPVIFYISNKTEVYEIDSYELPDRLDPSFSSEDIKQAKDYEKAVNEIIQSIRFAQ